VPKDGDKVRCQRTMRRDTNALCRGGRGERGGGKKQRQKRRAPKRGRTVWVSR